MPSKAAEAGDGAEMGSSTNEQRGVTAHEGCSGVTAGTTGELPHRGGGSTEWRGADLAVALEVSHLAPSSVLFGDRWDSRTTRNGGEESGEDSRVTQKLVIASSTMQTLPGEDRDKFPGS